MVRNNLATFVIDQPGRGRSIFDQSVLLAAKGMQTWTKVPSSFVRITGNVALSLNVEDSIFKGKLLGHTHTALPDFDFLLKWLVRTFPIRRLEVVRLAKARS